MSDHCIGVAVVCGAERRRLYSWLEYAGLSLRHSRAWSLYRLQRPSDRERRDLHMDGGILAVPRSMEVVMSERGRSYWSSVGVRVAVFIRKKGHP